MLDKLRRVWPGLAILVGLFGGLALCAQALWDGALRLAPTPGCRPADCATSLAERAYYDGWMFAIGVLGGGGLLIVGVVAAVRRGTRQQLGADACRSGIAEPERVDPLATARLRQRSDRVVTK